MCADCLEWNPARPVKAAVMEKLSALTRYSDINLSADGERALTGFIRHGGANLPFIRIRWPKVTQGRVYHVC